MIRTKIKYSTGFSLLEILIALTIISILTAIAIPNYHHYLIKTRRIEAEVTLLKLASLLEQHYIKNNTYKNIDIQSFIPDNKQQYYRYGLTACDTSFTLTAQPLAEQEKKDVECGALSLNTNGEKSTSGRSLPDKCW